MDRQMGITFFEYEDFRYLKIHPDNSVIIVPENAGSVDDVTEIRVTHVKGSMVRIGIRTPKNNKILKADDAPLKPKC